MTSPTSQAVTPTLDALIEGLISAARAEGGFGNNRRLADIVAAAAALREYVSARTLTRDEALFLYGITPHPGCTRSVGKKRDAIIERFLDVSASMKEHPE